MISRLHCSDDDLQRLLSGELSTDRSCDLTVHLEACATCQARLEDLSGSSVSVDVAGSFLREDTIDQELLPVDQEVSDADLTFLKPSEDPKAIGRFARFEIMEVLGRGGMSIVMRGFDPSLNRFCAVKVLSPELASSAAARRRFSREAKSAAAVVHPHVVPIHAVDEDDGLPFLVMPVVEGRSLEERVRQTGPLEVIEVVRIAAQVAEGLAAAHAQGLVHRDVKPGNVLLENGVERVQLTDFGLARAADDASMTRSGVIAGTPQYMSPEQAHGDAIDHRSDLFSLGGLIYFMCTGRSPFRAETTMGVLNRITNDKPRPLREINPDVPAWLEHFVLRLLNKSPDDRMQTARDVVEQLQQRLVQLQVSNQTSVEKTVELLPVSNLHSEASTAKTTGPQSDSGLTGHNRTGGGWHVWKVLAAAAFFAVLTTIIVLETRKGTVRIRTNSSLAVPVRILQGTRVVDELTVTAGEASTRIAAGEYLIEVVGQQTQYEVVGAQVKLSRGGEWIATIQEGPARKPDAADPGRPSLPDKVALRKVAAEFLQAFIENRYDDAVPLMSPDRANRLADRSKWDEAKEFAASLVIGGGDVVVSGNRALVSFDPVNPNVGDGNVTMVPGIILKKVDGTWGVQDMDFISPENSEKEIERWASGIPSPRQAPASAGGAESVTAAASDSMQTADEVRVDTAARPPGANSTDRLLHTLAGISSQEARIRSATSAVSRSSLPVRARAGMGITVGEFLCKQLFPDEPLHAFIAVRTGAVAGREPFPAYESSAVRKAFAEFIDTATETMDAAFHAVRDNDFDFVRDWIDVDDEHRAAFVLGGLVRRVGFCGQYTALRTLLADTLRTSSEKAAADPLRVLAWGHLGHTLSRWNGRYTRLAQDELNHLGSDLILNSSPQMNTRRRAIVHEWLSLAPVLNLNEGTTAQLALDVYLKDEQSDQFQFLNDPLDDRDPYRERRMDTRLDQLSSFIDSWPRAVNAVLEPMVKKAELSEDEVRLLRSLEFVLPAMRPPETKADLSKTAELLRTRLKRYYGPANAEAVDRTWQELLPIAPERLLALICLCEGRIPDFVVNGRPVPADARRSIAEFQRALSEELSLAEFQAAQDRISDVLKKAPYMSIAVAATAEGLPESVDRIRALYSAAWPISQFQEVARQRAPTDPILILCALGRVIEEAVENGVRSRAEAALAEYLTTASHRRLLHAHLQVALDDSAHVGQLVEDVLARIHGAAATPGLKTAIEQFHARIVHRLSAQRSAPPAVAGESPAADPLLFNGLTQPEWERRFRAETNPVAKIQAAQALVELSSGLDDAERFPRMMQVAGELVKEGFGPNPKVFLRTTILYRTKIYPTRWSLQSYPELQTTWKAFADSIEQVCESMPPETVAQAMHQVIANAPGTQAAFATDLLNKLKNTYDVNAAATDTLLQFRRPELEPYLSTSLMEYLEWGSSAVVESFVAHCEQIGSDLAAAELGEETFDAVERWFTELQQEKIPVSGEMKAKLARNMLQAEPRHMLNDLFSHDTATESEIAYPAEWMKQERAQHLALWTDWLPLMIQWGQTQPEANFQSKVMLSTLHAPLLVRTADDDWPMEELRAMLEQRIAQHIEKRPTDPEAESLHDLLSWLILAGGEIPEPLFSRDLPGSDVQLQRFAKHRGGLAQQRWEVLERALEPVRGLQATHPVAVARLAINYNEDFRDYRPLSMIQAVSDRGNGSDSPSPMEPLLLLAVAAELTGQTEIIDRNIALMFSHSSRSFARHIEDAVEYPFAIREVAVRHLRKMLDRALDQQLINTVGELVPGVARDLAKFVEGNPDTLIAITETYNEQTRSERTTLFDPPIPELNVATVKAAIREAADGYEKAGDKALAAALRETAKVGRLAKGLEMASVMGTSNKNAAGETTFRQILPSLQWKTGPKSYKAVVLDRIELRWSRDGWKSPGYGQIHPPLDGIWMLESVEQNGEPLTDGALLKWLTDHHSLRRLVIEDHKVKLLPPKHNNRQPDTVPPPAPRYDLKLYYEHSPPRFSMIDDRGAKQVEVYRGLFMGSVFLDNQSLKLILATDTSSWPQRFTSEETGATKLVYSRGDDEDAPLMPLSPVAATPGPATDRPAASGAPAVATVELLIDADGTLVLNGEAADEKAWSRHLAKLGQQHDAVDIRVKAAPESPFEVLQKLLDSATKILGDRAGKITFVVLPDSASHDESPSAMRPTPEIPAVTIRVTDPDGKSRTDVHLVLRATGHRGSSRRLEVKDQLSADKPILSRVLPYGNYYLKAETSDGWSGTMSGLQVEFGKGLDLTLVTPEPDHRTTVALTADLDFTGIEHFQSLPFGDLEWHQGSSAAFFPQPVQPPGQDQKELKSFPTPGDGIEQTGVRVLLQLQQEREASNGRPCTWRWHPEQAEPSFVLFAEGVQQVQEVGWDRVEAPADEGFFHVSTGTSTRRPRIQYLKYKLDQPQSYPHALRVPAGQLDVLLVGLVGRPTAAVRERLLTDTADQVEPVGGEILLAPELDRNSPWISHLFDTDGGTWNRFEGSGYFRLLHRHFDLKPDESVAVTIRSQRPAADP